MQNGSKVTTEKESRRKKLHLVAGVLLVLNGIPALIAGTLLVVEPSGSSLGLTINLLETSPFSNYLIPGIVLFTVNGVFSIITLYALIRKLNLYTLFIILQGILLSGWITFQIMFISDPSWLQLTYGFVGVLLIVSGLKLENLNNGKSAYQKI